MTECELDSCHELAVGQVNVLGVMRHVCAAHAQVNAEEHNCTLLEEPERVGLCSQRNYRRLPISETVLYPVPDILSRLGLADSAEAEQLLAGLRTYEFHGARFVRGADVVAYLMQRSAKPPSDKKPPN